MKKVSEKVYNEIVERLHRAAIDLRYAIQIAELDSSIDIIDIINSKLEEGTDFRLTTKRY